MLTHKQKISLARSRGFRNKEERSGLAIIHQPKGFMISKLFNTKAWLSRKIKLPKTLDKTVGQE